MQLILVLLPQGMIVVLLPLQQHCQAIGLVVQKPQPASASSVRCRV